MSTNDEETRRIKRISRWLWAACIILFLTAVLAGLSSCATPKTVNGRKVKVTKWVNGKVVYVLEESDADKAAMQRGKAESQAAAKSVVFAPTGK